MQINAGPENEFLWLGRPELSELVAERLRSFLSDLQGRPNAMILSSRARLQSRLTPECHPLMPSQTPDHDLHSLSPVPDDLDVGQVDK